MCSSRYWAGRGMPVFTVGFGSQVYTSPATGRQVDWMICGFSPRKANLSIHLMDGYGKRGALLDKLGKHSTGKGCLYIKRLSDVDVQVLKTLVEASVKVVKANADPKTTVKKASKKK